MKVGIFAIAVSLIMAIFIGAILFSLAPSIGGSIESSSPALGASSSWNATYNTGLPEGGTFLEAQYPYVGLLIVGIVGGLIIKVVMGW